MVGPLTFLFAEIESTKQVVMVKERTTGRWTTKLWIYSPLGSASRIQVLQLHKLMTIWLVGYELKPMIISVKSFSLSQYLPQLPMRKGDDRRNLIAPRINGCDQRASAATRLLVCLNTPSNSWVYRWTSQRDLTVVRRGFYQRVHFRWAVVLQQFIARNKSSCGHWVHSSLFL